MIRETRVRIGSGNDIHVLEEGRPMMIGGVKIPHSKGPKGHSDGDPLLHAVCDAVIGAMGKGDIGTLFPDSGEEYKDIPSIELLKRVASLMKDEGYNVGNIDCTVIAEEPKIGPYRNDMARVIAGELSMPEDRVNIKGKTQEGLGEIGKGNAISAYAVVLLVK